MTEFPPDTAVKSEGSSYSGKHRDNDKKRKRGLHWGKKGDRVKKKNIMKTHLRNRKFS